MVEGAHHGQIDCFSRIEIPLEIGDQNTECISLHVFVNLSLTLLSNLYALEKVVCDTILDLDFDMTGLQKDEG